MSAHWFREDKIRKFLGLPMIAPLVLCFFVILFVGIGTFFLPALRSGDGFIYLTIGSVLAAGLVLIGGIILMDRQRKAKYLTAAKALGFEYREKGQLPDPKFSLYSQGTQQRATHFLSSERDGRFITIFDFWYDYTVGGAASDSSPADYEQTVCLVRSNKMKITEFAVRPKGFLSRPPKGNIQLKSYPDFSSQFFLTGRDGQKVCDTFRPDVVEWFKKRKDIWVEGKGRSLLVFRHQTPIDPEQIKGLIREGLELVALLEKE